MCGIAGVVGSARGAEADRLTQALRHRGPDGQDTYLSQREGRPAAMLAHTRLSIIDPTDRGAQPMRLASDGRYRITYNGELYNFRELRRGLEGEGVAFRTETDTEVLLALYARRGPAMLEDLRGIYAFGIWDDERSELFLARDRLGVKPLYYTQVGNALGFASECRLLLDLIAEPRLNHGALADYLTFLWVPDPDTLFEGVHKLPPGHSAVFRDGRLTVSRHWDMEFAVEDRPEDEWAEAVAEGVSHAVGSQMVADVPIGAFLSGGIDSSAIVNEMVAAAGNATAFSVGFSAGDLEHDIIPDDLRFSRQMAASLGIDHREQILEANVVDLLPRLIRHLDDPVADPAAISTYLICSAGPGLKVMMSGMGGDEIFAGYPRHLAAYLARAGDWLPRRPVAAARRFLAERATLGPPGRLRGPRRNLVKLLRGVDQSPDERYLTYSSYYTGPELDRVLAPDLRAELSGHDPFRHHRAHLDRVRGEHWLNRFLYLDLKTFLPCLNLAYTDKMGMAASTEVRVPLLDDDLVALSGRIPPQLKLRRGRRKWIFKRSQVGRLPAEIINRPKAGFGAPVRAWVNEDLRGEVDALAGSDSLGGRGLLDPQEIGRVISANRTGAEDNALRIWALLVLELWLREFRVAL